MNLFKKTKATKVVLREERSDDNYRFLSAELKDNGDLVFEGQDLGTDVKLAFGASEYEWYWTINSKDVPLFQKALGIKGDTISIIKKKFSKENCIDIKPFMERNNIPFENWSRIGD